jgi:hypothetical protein
MPYRAAAALLTNITVHCWRVTHLVHQLRAVSQSLVNSSAPHAQPHDPVHSLAVQLSQAIPWHAVHAQGVQQESAQL